MQTRTRDLVLERLGVEPGRDFAALTTLYEAWCRSIPFDNTLKLIHFSEQSSGRLPGSSAEEFFESWLELGTGGTCWAGNGALYELLADLGFAAERAIATMQPAPDTQRPNHGSVIVTIDGERWIVDASILSGKPVRIEPPGFQAEGPLPRFEWIDAKPVVRWRMLMAPEGFPCRIDRIGASSEEWDALHQRTAAWSPFNYVLSTRQLRNDESIGAAGGQLFRFTADGDLSSSPLEGSARTSFLIDTLGIPESLALRVPPDQPIPPRP